jgi:predicted RNA-binding Zn ribbon-like protein
VVPPAEGTQPAGRSPAPGGLRLVQDFVNTMNHEFEPAADGLGTAERAGEWLAGRGLLAAGAPPLSARDVAAARELREALRAVLEAHTGGGAIPPAARAVLERASARARLRLRLDAAGRPALLPEAEGFAGAAGLLLAALHAAALDGTLERLKACEQCGWAFYDRSRNRSSRWCSMLICGARSKRRAYRRRQRR